MRRLWDFLTNSRVLTCLGLAAAIGLLLLGAGLLGIALLYVGLALLAALAIAGLYWLARHLWHRRQGRLLGEAVAAAPPDARPDVAALRQGLADAITTIKTSKLGLARGAAALYELPWYMVIGHPSAGKSSAIASSGLQFPLAGNAAMRGVGGTRNCDWFFSTEGILLDTAGRYSVQEEDRAEWFGFLSLLRRYRRRAPINGIIIAASLSDLMKGPPDTNMELARHLRTRVQELTERLGVHAPVYQVCDKGVLDDAEGRTIDFRNTLIIMTSNAGSALVMQACLNKPAEDMPNADALATIVRPALAKHFKPAFLGRVTLVPFYPVGDDVLAEIVVLKLDRIRERVLANHQAAFRYDDALVEAVLARCTEVDSGARNVDAILNGTLLPAIADTVLARMATGEPIERIAVSASEDGQFVFHIA